MTSLAPRIVSTSSVPDAICMQLRRFGLHRATEADCIEAQVFASRMISDGVVTAETLIKVNERSGAALFLRREQGVLTGALAMVLLSRQGLGAIYADRFDAVAVNLDHVARAGEQPAGVYAWGVAASTSRAGRGVVAGGWAISHGPLAHLPCFARTVTPDGRRLLTQKMSFKPLAGSRTGLLVWDRPSALGDAA